HAKRALPARVFDEEFGQTNAGGARASAKPEQSGADCVLAKPGHAAVKIDGSAIFATAGGAKPGAAQPQQPATRQARSRESGAGVLPGSPVFDALQMGAGSAAARPAATEPRTSAHTMPYAAASEISDRMA